MTETALSTLGVFALLCATSVLLSVFYHVVCCAVQGRLPTLIADILFSLLAFPLLFWLNLHFNNGACRWYVFVAMVGGWLLPIYLCKSMLDKLRVALYNLFTTIKVDKVDGTHFLQQKIIRSVRGSNVGADSASLHVANFAHANGSHQSKGGRANRTNRTSTK